ncbi:MAG: type IV toxin-antitoxin system AbiEi family antitoxin [Elusimicrobiota bacterium]
MKCVHPIQLYLDLMKGHPERAKEAAEMIKSSIEF